MYAYQDYLKKQKASNPSSPSNNPFFGGPSSGSSGGNSKHP